MCNCAFHQEGIGRKGGDGIKHSNAMFNSGLGTHNSRANWENQMQLFKNNYRTQSKEHVLKQEQTLFYDLWEKNTKSR